MTDSVLFERCESALKKLLRAVPNPEAALAFEVTRLLEELEKRSKPKAPDFAEIRAVVEAAPEAVNAAHTPSPGYNVLPPSDR